MLSQKIEKITRLIHYSIALHHLLIFFHDNIFLDNENTPHGKDTITGTHYFKTIYFLKIPKRNIESLSKFYLIC